MRLFENILLTRALLALGAGLAHEVDALPRRNPATAQAPKEQPEKLTRQQRRARARLAGKGRK